MLLLFAFVFSASLSLLSNKKTFNYKNNFKRVHIFRIVIVIISIYLNLGNKDWDNHLDTKIYQMPNQETVLAAGNLVVNQTEILLHWV